MSILSSAGRGLIFAFWPFAGLRPDWGYTRRLAVRGLALPLISAGLLPLSHPAGTTGFLAEGPTGITGAQVIRDGARAVPWRQAFRTWQDFDQALTWIIVAFAWLSVWLIPAGWGLYFFIGTAEAQTITTAVVAEIAGNDVASRWLRAIFGVTTGAPDLAAAQSGLGAMLQVYNAALLGVAAIAAIYHSVAVVLDFGREGRTDRRHNLPWTAVRTVVVFGLLAPLAGGWSGGEQLPIWVAGQGSKIATSMWTAFTDTIASGRGAIVTPPLNRDYEDILGTALKIETCMAAMNAVAGRTGDSPYITVNVNRALSVPWSQQITGIERSYDGTSYYPRGACGVQRFVPLENRPEAGAKAMAAAQRDALMAVIPDLQALARWIVLANDPNPQIVAQNPQPSTAVFRALADKYAAALTSRVAGAVAAQNGQLQQDLATDAKAAGWIMAPALMTTIARLNGSILEEAGRGPQVIGPAPEKHWSDEVTRPLAAADMLWHSALADVGRPHFRSTALGTSQSALDEIFGRFGFAEIVAGFQLRSSDPAAELAAFGHRLINWALGVFAAAMVITGGAGAASAVPGLGIVGQGLVAMANFASPLLTMLVTVLLGAGGTLAVILPWLPAVRWVLGCASWLVSLVEAVIGVPLMLLAMLRTDGAGLGAKQGGFMLLSIALRPMIMVVAIVASYQIFAQAIALWNLLFVPTMASIQGGSSQGLIVATMHVVLYSSTAWAIANISFKAIDVLPSVIIRWIGGQALGDADATGSAMAPVNKTAETVGQAGQRGTEGLSKPTGGKEMRPLPEPQTQDMLPKAQ